MHRDIIHVQTNYKILKLRYGTCIINRFDKWQLPKIEEKTL